ncbi:MAG: rRNA maturation RNase YbeY [Chloroflexi bacterium]|nr:rRNA maturation RNase YbeY [Chloroflexota bacterium]MBV9600391.1 rRNA maturation RNase YbeY [Chloroflexota bacterium]
MIVDFAVEDGIPAAWDEPRITALVASIVARELPSTADYAVSLHLVGDPTIRELNADHRGHDVATDVLSFPLFAPGFVLPAGEPVHLGDVVISYPRATAQADEYGHSVEREVAYLVAHGLLHVLGYDHEESAERARMRQKEEEALQPLGFTRE